MRKQPTQFILAVIAVFITQTGAGLEKKTSVKETLKDILIFYNEKRGLSTHQNSLSAVCPTSILAHRTQKDGE